MAITTGGATQFNRLFEDVSFGVTDRFERFHPARHLHPAEAPIIDGSSDLDSRRRNALLVIETGIRLVMVAGETELWTVFLLLNTP